MAVNWTEEQRQVIDLRHRNLLVSAAAGSGKTAVLVARILSLITDPEHPADIDRLLVVTFTRAAAGEMKERIGRALEERLRQDPDNAHLQRQGVLLDHAQISTIDGFCTFVLQNYYHRIGLDPGYRIAEENELKVLQNDVLAQMLEEEYEAAQEPFLRFVRAYGDRRSDRALEELILKIHAFAVSDPSPDRWLAHCLEAYSPKTEEELTQTDWMQELLQKTGAELEGLRQQSERLADLAEARPDGPQAYIPTLRQDAAMLAAAGRSKTYEEYRNALAGIQFGTLSRSIAENEDRKLRESVKKLRDSIKKEVIKIQTQTFSLPAEDVLRETAALEPYARELIRLVRRFREAYTEAKRERDLLDFPDLELLALQILAEEQEDGTWVPTEAARELAERFEEVMIDEYQDSNYLQEALLGAISRTAQGRQNRFMVGDVKQSIYGFRQARPDLFLEKYSRYTEPEAGVRIDLHQNFRSRPEILDSVNAVFSRIMIPELGGIAYDDAAALHAGASFPAEPETAQTELLVIDKDDPVFREIPGSGARVEAEALAAAERILAMTRYGRLWDAEKQAYRPVTYRDCVILMRAANTRGDIFVRVLQEKGIPAYAVSGKGYFSTIEVSAVLNYLRVCDNPLQDIPLAAALRSPIGGLTDAELAGIRAAHPEGSLYSALQRFVEETSPETESGTRERTGRFLAQLSYFREIVPRTPIHTLLSEILDKTGYGDYAAAMPAGSQRQANLEMLAERAVEYEKTQYHGLFSFIRYIEQLEESRVDPGEASLYGEEENIVRIMTIHKSKGLEFPVVILAGMGNSHNRTDETSRVVMHQRLGIGMAAVYPEEHRKHMNTLVRAAVRSAVRQDMTAEELRVLYVAMTRAKEKLILIGTGENAGPSPFAGEAPTYQQILSAKSYLEWIRLADGPGYPVRETVLQAGSLGLSAVSEEIRLDTALQKIRTMLEAGGAGAYDPQIRELLEKKERFRYRYAEEAVYPAKVTVSELKRMAEAVPEEEETEELYPQETVVPYIPGFMQQISGETAPAGREAETAADRLTGAARGTAYHQVFASLDYARILKEGTAPETVQAEISRMKEAGLLSETEAAAVRPEDFCRFLESPLGRRMAAAGKTLRREQPFVLDVPARELFPDRETGGGSAEADTEKPGESAAYESGEPVTVLIQGTIDAYWEENGEFILVDYKTDRLQSPDGAELVGKYRKQLEYYARALTQITEIPVREMWIYSVYAGAIRVYSAGDVPRL